jgi:hypothetical protein
MRNKRNSSFSLIGIFEMAPHFQQNNTQQNDTQPNDVQHNDTQHNDIKHTETQHNSKNKQINIKPFKFVHNDLNISIEGHYAECRGFLWLCCLLLS